MRYKIISVGAYTGKMKLRVFLRWFFYSLTLLLLYSLMCCGAFGSWQPYFIVALAVGVSMYEQEFSSSVFGIFCGLVLDMATGTLFGFHAVMLMPFCFLTALLSRNLIKVNFVNHIIATAVTLLAAFSVHYLFTYIVWDTSGGETVILSVLLPSFIATVVTAPAMYFLTKLISEKLSLAGKDILDLSDEAAESAEEIKKTSEPVKEDSK